MNKQLLTHLCGFFLLGILTALVLSALSLPILSRYTDLSLFNRIMFGVMMLGMGGIGGVGLGWWTYIREKRRNLL